MASLTFQHQPLHTSGELPSIGSHAPDFKLTNGKLEDVSLAQFTGKIKILTIVPSLDTPVCAASARKFNEKASQLDNTVILVVSADLPFAQCRFCELEGLNKVVPLSSFRSNFAEVYGVKLIDTCLAGLTARAIIIIDDHDKVRYTELVTELTNEPDYEKALSAV
jgi:thiol peroxidase